MHSYLVQCVSFIYSSESCSHNDNNNGINCIDLCNNSVLIRRYFFKLLFRFLAKESVKNYSLFGYSRVNMFAGPKNGTEI